MRIPFIKYDHQKPLDEIPKIPQNADEYKILLHPSVFRETLLNSIKHANKRIYIVSLYLEKDEAGHEILESLFQLKMKQPSVEIKIFVDWHRAQRGRIGEYTNASNADYYYQMKQRYPDCDIPIYGVPINRRELLGVLHLKGLIIDNCLFYSGASINNVYLQKLDKYRYDRYHIIMNKILTDSMVHYIHDHFVHFDAVQRLDINKHQTRKQLRHQIKILRQHLKTASYQYLATSDNSQLTVTPISGLGKNNPLNKIIHHLINVTQEKITFCTPYFNLPNILVRDIIRLLKKGRHVEIIIGDKVANDFYIPPDKPFNISGGLPYLYEINLRRFTERLQRFIDKDQLVIRLWKDEDNSYHLKGVWIDDKWALITGNNLNPRAWRLDLENGILVHDPHKKLHNKFVEELTEIKKNTIKISHFQQIQASQFYPKHIHKLITRLSRIRVDRIIKRLL